MWGNLRRALQPAKADPRSGVGTWHLAPGYGHCLRCRTAWKFVEGHSTYYNLGRGCFPLCEMCWSEMEPHERLPFYYVLYRQWEWDAGLEGLDAGVTWEALEAAVMAEGKPADED